MRTMSALQTKEMLWYFILSLLWVSPSAQAQEFTCSVCADGAAIGNPQGIVTTLQGQTASCTELETYATQLPPSPCESLQSLALVPCECPGFNVTVPPTVTTSNVADTFRAEPFECLICGSGGEIGNPNGMTLNTVGRPTSCQTLYDNRASISKSACPAIQAFSRTPCGCRTKSATLNNTAVNGTDINATTQAFVCSICGDDRIGNPNGIVVNNRGQRRSCSALDANKENIPETACATLQKMAREPCECTSPGFGSNSTNSPGTNNDEIPFLCSICGDGGVMTNPQGSFSPRQGRTVTCGALEANANMIPQGSCANIQALAQEPCGCEFPGVGDQVLANSTGIDDVIGNATMYECPICNGGEMTIPQGIVVTRQGQSARCDVLVANANAIPENACPNIQALARDACGCILPAGNETISNTTEASNETAVICSICGEGVMSNPDGIVTTPQGQTAKCSALDANSNTIPLNRCVDIQALAAEPCGCPAMNTTPANEDIFPVCHVCGEGREVGIPGKMITTSLGVFTCTGIQQAGLWGNVPADHCNSVTISAQEECGCTAEGPTAAPSEAPFSCKICGNGRIVTRPNVLMYVSGTLNNITCGQYEAAAANGDIDEDQCPILQQASEQACGCTNAPPAPTPAPTTYECPICGEGRVIGLPEAEVVLPNTQRMTCESLQRRSEMGIIQETQCIQVQPFVRETCGCVDALPMEPTDAPTVYECPICGEGMKVMIPDGEVVIPTQPVRTCEELLEAAAIGNINPSQCRLLQPFVLTPCGCVDDLSDIPSDSPSLSPTAPTFSPAPTTILMRDDCFADLGDIYELERNVENTTVKRKYVLCPGRTFHMGVWSDEDEEIKDGEPFLALRPNVVYQCGEDGSRMNNCILKGGDFAIASYYGALDGIREMVTGVEIRGLTFESQKLFSVLLKAAGDVTFFGCAFKKNSNKTPILIQWEGDGPNDVANTKNSRALTSAVFSNEGESHRHLQNTEEELDHVVTFQDCVFRDNYVNTTMSFPGIIENTFNSKIVVTNCLFENNTYGNENNPTSYGHAIRTFGPLTLDSNCFVDNEFLDHGPILVYGTQFSAWNNYVESSQTDLSCEFLALFSSQDDTSDISPTCELSDAATCSFTQPPTMAPTESPPSKNQNTDEQPGTTTEPPAIPPVSEQEKADTTPTSSASAVSSRRSISIQLGCCLLSFAALYLSAIHHL